MPKEIAWEIILVDNSSTDDTAKVGKQEWHKHQVHIVDFRVIIENKPGLNCARNAGTNAAKYETILFCDDDNWLNRDYLSNAYHHLNINPKLGIAGAGNARAVYEITPTPQWFVDFQHFCCVYEMGNEHKIDLNCDASVLAAGAGMCIRRQLLIDYFKQQTESQFIFDRVKDHLSSGGDTDINYFSLRRGYGIGLFADLNYTHYIPAARINKKYLNKLAYSLTFSSLIVAYKNQIVIRKWNTLGLLKNFALLLLKRKYFSLQVSWQQYRAYKEAMDFLENNKKFKC